MAKKPITKQAESAKPSPSTIIAELAYARCAFQLATICAVMGMTPPPLEGEK